MRTLAVVTTSRADYGIYRPVLRRIETDPDLRLRLIVSGMHLVEDFGLTVRQIEADGFDIAGRLDTLERADDPFAVARSMGRAVGLFAEAYERSRPDILVVLGDRFEMHPAALAALPFRIPVAHLHGGEVTEGAIDESLRHCITKLSHLHFASTDVYARRIVQMGEEPWRVTCCGAPGLDNLRDMEWMDRAELSATCGCDLPETFLLAVYHPVTLEHEGTAEQFARVCEALERLDVSVLFTRPNADTGGRLLIELLERFVAAHERAHEVANLPTRAYLSAMRLAAAMVGNSSSGIVEAGSFGLPVVNIGRRQTGRVRGPNVIDVPCDTEAIANALRRALTADFRAGLKGMVNPYGRGDAAERIVARLKEVPLDRRLIVKKFHDLSSAGAGGTADRQGGLSGTAGR